MCGVGVGEFGTPGVFEPTAEVVRIIKVVFACIRGNSIVRIVALTEADATQANCKRLSSSAWISKAEEEGSVVSAGKLR